MKIVWIGFVAEGQGRSPRARGILLIIGKWDEEEDDEGAIHLLRNEAFC